MDFDPTIGILNQEMLTRYPDPGERRKIYHYLERHGLNSVVRRPEGDYYLRWHVEVAERAIRGEH